MAKMNFICTSDKETRDKLIDLGFELIESTDKMWKFINNGLPLNFSKEKIAYTNMLNM